MHATFISECSLKALPRTRRVLDAYAIRKGERTWITPITHEAVAVVHSQLKAVATRQTAVACFINDGRSDMRLLWTVGRKEALTPQGAVCVNTRGSKIKRSRTDLAPGVRAAALVARAAGYVHDFGKAFEMFQLKLAGEGSMKDAVRHEWISMQILMQGLLDDDLPPTPESLRSAWERACTIEKVMTFDELHDRLQFGGGLVNATSAFSYLVYTHHRMPAEAGRGQYNKLDEGEYVMPDWAEQKEKLKPRAAISVDTMRELRRAFDRLRKLDALIGPDPLAWRAVSTVARAALILADHGVSSIDVSQRSHDRGSPRDVLYANTVRTDDGRRVFNQELDWHLRNVGDQAGRILSRMISFQPGGVSQQVREALRTESQQSLLQPELSRFSWQARNASLLAALQTERTVPTLVLNIAGTGCGKTRANVLFADSLRRDQDLRIATALNLRTLTLQTRDAYAKQLGMRPEDLACVLGSALTKRLHDAKEAAMTRLEASEQASFVEDEDGNEFEDGFEAVGDADVVPQWLEAYLSKDPRMRALVTSPVAVCTMDFLVAAGDPTRQGVHGLAMLRMMNSDLILDEIDSYDSKALVAVMRVVTAAAMWGRNIIASSATLSSPVATALWEAFDLGLRMGRAMGVLPVPDGRQVLIDDANEAAVATHHDANTFDSWYRSSIADRCSAMGRKSLRPAEVITWTWTPGDIAGSTLAARNRIAEACDTMHARLCWPVMVEGVEHQVSFGLVRIANISPAVELAKHLCEVMPHASVGCYHAQMPRMHRHELEFVLDGLLQRGRSAPANEIRLNRYPTVMEAIKRDRSAGRRHSQFILVATPVEEIGRDHDFDWGVIEPSSTQSIVQTTGRINRHRLIECRTPNVALMRWNFAKMAARKTCFSSPGLEDEETLFADGDMETLIDWEEIDRCGQIDARLRYSGSVHRFADLDDRSSQRQIQAAARRFMKSDQVFWMGAATYKEVRLREQSLKESWTQDTGGDFYLQERIGARSSDLRWRRTAMAQEKAPQNAWLSWSHSDLVHKAASVGIGPLEAMAAEVRPASGNRKLVFNQAFGYYLK